MKRAASRNAGAIKEVLARLGELAKRPLAESDLNEIRRALSSPNHLMVAKAAKVVGERGLTEFLRQLAGAFGRFMESPSRTDMGCLAKTAIVEALDTLESDDIEIFNQGIRHVQMEPVFGGRRDTAATLRARCALALARLEVVDIFFQLTSLLADPEPQARVGAVRALTYLNEEKSELLLRLKLLAGDREPQVLSECFAGLMSIHPERSLPFVASYLSSADIVTAEGAALALGESRSARALEALIEHREESFQPEMRMMLLLPIALIRSEEAVDYLLDVLRDERPESAAGTMRALKVYAHDEAIRQRIHQLVVDRAESTIAEAYRRTFAIEAE